MAGDAAVVIKRIKKGGHGGHHGGAWKVAYADFVTAMMAFFLLMWLINTTTPEQKRGIADYFAAQNISKTTRARPVPTRRWKSCFPNSPSRNRAPRPKAM